MSSPSPFSACSVTSYSCRTWIGIVLATIFSSGIALNPVKFDGSSLDCKGADLAVIQIVNCNFQTLPDSTRLPTDPFSFFVERQAKVKEFYMDQTNLEMIRNNSFQYMTSLQTLSLRGNHISLIEIGAFVGLGSLQEVSLEENLLTMIHPAVFTFTPDLKLLRLGSNRLSELPTSLFSPMNVLEELHLENNLLTAVPPLAQTTLEELFLQRNHITMLRDGTFNALTSLRELHLEINSNLRRIEENVFNPALAVTSSLTVLRMIGSPSHCVKRAGAVQCMCAEGYVSVSVDDSTPAGAHFCVPNDCGTSIPGLATMNAEADCTTTQFNESCTAECVLGFFGSSGHFTCGADGQWAGEMSCTRVTCGAGFTNATAKYSASCGDAVGYGQSCTATCIAGHTPTPGTSADFLCTVDSTSASTGVGVYEGNLTCDPKDCGSNIPGLNQFAVYAAAPANCTGNTRYGGDPCTIGCQSGFGDDSVTYTCGESGVWIAGTDAAPLPPIQCIGEPCPVGGPVPIDPNAIAKCRGNIAVGGDACEISCKLGYQSTASTPVSADCYGDECVECNPSPLAWEPSQLQCERLTCTDGMEDIVAILDPFVNRTISCGQGPSSPPRFQDTCNISCVYGYVPKDVPFKCDATAANSGLWVGDIQCSRYDCGSASVGSDPRATVVSSTCVDGGEYDPSLRNCSNDTRWDAATPAQRVLRCDGMNDGVPLFTEDREVTCTPFGWTLEPESAIAVDDEFSFAHFCRADCGSVVGQYFEECTGDTGYGSSCTAQCESFPQYTANFTCTVNGTWQESDTDVAQFCVATSTTTSSTTTATFTTRTFTTIIIPEAEVSSQSAGEKATMILIPIIIVLIIIIVLLYYYGYLACLGLVVGKKRPGAQKRPRGGLGKGTVNNPAYSAPTSTATSGPAVYAVGITNMDAYGSPALQPNPQYAASSSATVGGFAVPTASDAAPGSTSASVNQGGFNVPVGI
eukprot:m.949637 g.949637  ORF g.949637 m.949637 type:complete len:973 (-) comp23856_c0_seq1:77-2995(-)